MSPFSGVLGKELEEIALDLAAIELERIVAMCCQLWVVPVKRPVAAVHCHLAVLNGLGHWESLTDAGGVGQDDARSCGPTASTSKMYQKPSFSRITSLINIVCDQIKA